jgi:hypothetical protein
MTVALSFVVGSFAYVNAEEILEERAATEVENIISDVSSDAIAPEDIIEPELVGDELVIEGDAMDLSIPLEGDGDIKTELFSISLPEEASDAEAVITSDGTVTYGANDSDETTVAVQTTDEQTRIHTVIPNKDAPNRYTYEISDGIPFLNTDGSVDIKKNLPKIDEEGEFVTGDNGEFVYELFTVGKFDVPWAKDATGNDVDTHYEIVNNAVVQVIGFDENTQFPVTADPSVDWVSVFWCAVELLVFIAAMASSTFVIKIITKVTAVVKKSAKIAKLVSSLGGVKKLFSKFRAYILNKNSLSKTDRAAVGTVLLFLGDNVLDFLGFGSCGKVARDLFR